MDSGASSYHRFLSGDKTGLEEIIRSYSDSLTIYICKLVGNIEDAREIMSETFIEIYVKKPDFSGKSSFKTWLYSVARFLTYDYIKHKKKQRKLSDAEISCFPSEEDLEKKVIADEEKHRLYDIIDNLNPEYRQIIHLVYLEGFSNSEAAEIMGKSMKQTGELLYRAKQALKKIIERNGDDFEGLL